MRVYKQESARYVIERHKGQAALSVSELCQAMQYMPNGWGVQSIENRPDGTTIVQLQALTRVQVV